MRTEVVVDDETGSQLPDETSGDAVVTTPAATEATGHPVVDEVLSTLEGLEDTPVAEHVQVFEAAHDRLRSTLANAGDDA
jgi:hypothetical protein